MLNKMANDETLVKLTLSGDNDAYGQLVRKYQSAVYGLCYHLAGNFADAQDLTQEAFVLAYQDLYQLREPSKFASWLNQVTRNVCRMWLRKKNDNLLSIEDASEVDFIDQKTPSPLEEMEKEEMRQFVRQAINTLSERNRLAVTLFYMDGLSYKDIGDFLGISVSTVKSRLHEARKQLKEEFFKVVKKNFEEHKLPQDFADKVLCEVSVLSIAMDDNNQQPIVFLANKEDDLQRLPIWIGIPESQAIERALQGQETPRPMTHDLVANILRECGIKLTAAVVAEIRETTFYGKLILDSNGEVKAIDSRPSDAIAIALRMNAPIFVEQSVLDQNGISSGKRD